MEKRKENPELKPYVEEYIINMLEKCELFTRTFGKGFARERLKTNFKAIYTDELNSRAAGQYTLGTSGVITLFSKGFNGNLLTFKEIEEDESLRTTTLHEGVHAVFNKTPKECQQHGISCGSGLHWVYDGGYSKNEIGRAMNEGFTNWVCIKAGLDPKSYYKFTNMIKLFELAIGPEKVMQFGRGDIDKNIAPLLDMQTEECVELFSKADLVHDYDDKALDFHEAKTLLSSKLKIEKGIDGVIPDYINEDVQKLNNNDLYRRITKNPEYLQFAQEKSLDPESDETKMQFFTEMDEFYSKKSKVLLDEVQAQIVSKYFIKEIDEIIRGGDCSLEQYERIGKISRSLFTYGERTNDVLKNFDEKIDELRKRFYNKSIEEVRQSINDRTITPEKLEYYMNLFQESNFKDAMELEEEVTMLMLPENPYTYYDLFHKLSYNKKLSNLFNYKIFSLKTENGKEENLFFDTKQNEHFSRYIQSPKIIGASEEIEDTDGIIDITLTSLQSVQEIVNNFLKLKEEIKKKTPNAKIQIVENIIISTDETNQPSFYMIEGNEIVPAQVTELVPQNRRSKEDINLSPQERGELEQYREEGTEKTLQEIEIQQEDTSLKPISKNPFKRFFENIRGKILSIKESFSSSKKTEPEVENKPEDNTNPSKKFDERIHVDVTGKIDQTQSPIKIKPRIKSTDDDLIK